VQSLPADHPFRKHSGNLRAVVDGLVQAERSHKAAIRRNNTAEVGFAARIHQMMVALLAEAYLRKIIADPNGFNEVEVKLLAQKQSQESRWKRVVEFAFRRHYRVLLHEPMDATTLTATSAAQYDALTTMIEQDLVEVIGDRNKTAHAQWRWRLNSGETNFLPQPAPGPLNYQQIARRAKIIDRLARLVYVLAVSEPTFQRDFDETYAEITQLRAAIDGADYPQFVAELRRRSRRQ
jgi:hypothetical protein